MVIQGTLDRPDTCGEHITSGWSKHEMTTIRTTCPLCGDVELAPGELSLELAAIDGTGNYVFACPECGDRQRRPANHRVVAILLATGVAYQVKDDRGPITEAEIAQFSEQLDRGDWAEQLR
jgi:predicted RNA-binding Zn-ribbon protein involved in translation (DUF1610 family)